MKRYKFKLFMERELFAEGNTPEEARMNLIEEMASGGYDYAFKPDSSDYVDDGVEES